jgi:hypothetical protein
MTEKFPDTTDSPPRIDKVEANEQSRKRLINVAMGMQRAQGDLRQHMVPGALSGLLNIYNGLNAGDSLRAVTAGMIFALDPSGSRSRFDISEYYGALEGDNDRNKLNAIETNYKHNFDSRNGSPSQHMPIDRQIGEIYSFEPEDTTLKHIMAGMIVVQTSLYDRALHDQQYVIMNGIRQAGQDV